MLYGVIVFAGLFFDVLIYTIWLKRRTAWSIVWGGLAGGMPVLAGRAPERPLYATFEDGHHEMVVCDAIAQSAGEGRWVDVA